MSSGSENCPFCREMVPDDDDDEEYERRIMKRVDANDPAAMAQMGTICYEQGDYDGAVKYWEMAAELGDLEAHYGLGVMYEKGEGVEEDEEKAVCHWEVAAIGGHPSARRNLAVIEERNGWGGFAIKHFIIAAKLGDDGSMKGLLQIFRHGCSHVQKCLTKDDLEATLRAHQAAIDAMKSPQREAAAAAGYCG
jgi:TPR repeat protein